MQPKQERSGYPTNQPPRFEQPLEAEPDDRSERPEAAAARYDQIGREFTVLLHLGLI